LGIFLNPFRESHDNIRVRPGIFTANVSIRGDFPSLDALFSGVGGQENFKRHARARKNKLLRKGARFVECFSINFSSFVDKTRSVGKSDSVDK
jgi:hypothetical protein